MKEDNSQPFDRIFKENLQDIFPVALSAITGSEYTDAKPLPADLPKTLSRKPDFLYRAKLMGDTVVLHIEVQRKIDYRMHGRMLLYAALLYDKYQLPVKQLVLYIGGENGTMPVQIIMPDFTYQYQLVDFRQIPYRQIMASDNPSVVLLAVLGDFGNEPGEAAVKNIIGKLAEVSRNPVDLGKFAYQLQILGDLRNLGGIITELEHTMLDEIKIEETSLYKKGGKDTALKAATTLLRKGVKPEIVAEALDLSIEQIEELRKGLGK